MEAEEIANELSRTLLPLVQGIQVLFKEGLLGPALVLLYSTIDTMAWLSRPVNSQKTDRNDFIRWVDEYILPNDSIPCTALELYKARCGVVHSHTTEFEGSTSLSQLFYVPKENWDEINGLTKRRRADFPNPNLKISLIDQNELLLRTIQGIISFIEKTSSDPYMSSVVLDRSRQILSSTVLE
jgi:hypothetical protein